jgi:hypothetical protein
VVGISGSSVCITGHGVASNSNAGSGIESASPPRDAGKAPPPEGLFDCVTAAPAGVGPY